MKLIINVFLCIFILKDAGKAQVIKADLQASGLTCSMCNKSIHKSLATISNVNQIVPDLNNNSFAITFKDSSKVDIDELKTKVEKAGYKLANLDLYVTIPKQELKADSHITIDSNFYHFVNISTQQVEGVKKLRVVDKGFVSSKEFKKVSATTTYTCMQTGYMQNCCTNKQDGAQRIFHVTF